MRTSLATWAIHLVLAMAVYLVLQLYTMLNHQIGPIHLLATNLDTAMPFIPTFVVPYNSLLVLLYGSLAYFFFYRPTIFRSMAASTIVVSLATYGIYFLYQTQVGHAHIGPTHGDWFLTQVAAAYRPDHFFSGPYNDFPSLPAALATIAAIHWIRVLSMPDRATLPGLLRLVYVVALLGVPFLGGMLVDITPLSVLLYILVWLGIILVFDTLEPQAAYIVVPWAALIVVSVLFIRQGYLLDIMGALIIAILLSALSLTVLVWQDRARTTLALR